MEQGVLGLLALALFNFGRALPCEYSKDSYGGPSFRC
jgi:hypothetical protein